jgi:hypothetical protein
MLEEFFAGSNKHRGASTAKTAHTEAGKMQVERRRRFI